MSEVKKINKIVLVGYMGSGKSSIGKLLADQLELPFYDLDSLIEKKARKTISNIFSEKGEAEFRKMESSGLKRWLNECKKGVLATGGGTPCHDNNMQIINRQSTAVYLKASIDELSKRLIQNKERPLIKGKSEEDLRAFIRAHLKIRKPFYEKASIRVLSRGEMTEIVDRIISKL